MAQLKATVTKEEFEALAEPVREFYTQTGDKYALEAPEGFSPKSKVDEFRQNNISLRNEVDEFKKKYGDLDPEEAREALKLKQEREEKKLKDDGEFDKALEVRVSKMREEHKKEREKLEEELKNTKSQLSARVIDDAIKATALKVGVLPKALEDVVFRANRVWRLNEKGNPVAIKDGETIYGADGNPIGMEEWVSNLKADHDYLFGQPAGGGGGDGDRPAPGPRKKRSEMTRKEKSDYVDKYGQEAFLKLPR